MSTLKQLVDETTNIKNELKTCHTNLKSNLIEKGVECSDADKLLSLVGKVGEIELGKKWASGTSVVNSSKISVRGLNFKPRFIYGYQTGVNYYDKRSVVYCSSPMIDIYAEHSNYFEDYGKSVIYSDGFDLWVANAREGANINWQVYE